MADVWCGRANRIFVDVISKAKKPWFWCIKSKSCVSPRRNYHFWGFSKLPNYFDLHCFDVSSKTRNPLILVQEMKKQVFRLGENAFFCNSTCYLWIDEVGTTCQTTLQTTFIQGNDVETKQQDLSYEEQRAIDRPSYKLILLKPPADILWWFFSHSNCSCSSRNVCGSGLSRVERQHHMNTYCLTDGCIVECHVYMHITAHTETGPLTLQVHMNVNTCPTPPHPTPPMSTCT